MRACESVRGCVCVCVCATTVQGMQAASKQRRKQEQAGGGHGDFKWRAHMCSQEPGAVPLSGAHPPTLVYRDVLM